MSSSPTLSATSGSASTIPPPLPPSFPIIVFFHGGGFAFMSATSKPYDDFCQRLARQLPTVVVSVNYRLAPEHRYSCQYDDRFHVLKFIDDSQSSGSSSLFEGANLRQCFLAGDSAGGNIAHHVAIIARGLEFRDLKVVGMLAIQPFFGGEEQTESETRLVNIERKDWMSKAFLSEGSDISGIVVVEGFDPSQDWQKRNYEGLNKRGKQAELVVFPNAIHTFYAYPELDDSSVFTNRVRDFVKLQSVNVTETRQ